jgi:hypothetical protein
MSGSRSLLTALVIGIALTVAGSAAAENVLRFTSLSGGPATMGPPFAVERRRTRGEHAGL